MGFPGTPHTGVSLFRASKSWDWLPLLLWTIFDLDLTSISRQPHGSVNVSSLRMSSINSIDKNPWLFWVTFDIWRCTKWLWFNLGDLQVSSGTLITCHVLGRTTSGWTVFITHRLVLATARYLSSPYSKFWETQYIQQILLEYLWCAKHYVKSWRWAC